MATRSNLPEILRDLEVKKVVESNGRPQINWATHLSVAHEITDAGHVRVISEGADGGASLARVAQLVGDALANVYVARGLDVDRVFVRYLVALDASQRQEEAEMYAQLVEQGGQALPVVRLQAGVHQ